MEILDKFLNLNKKLKFIILFNIIIGLLILCMQFFFAKHYYNTVPILFILINFITCVAYIFSIFYIFYQKFKLNNQIQDIENLQTFNNSLTYSYDSVRGFKHDFDNIINIISGYIQLNDMTGLKQYFSSLEKDCIRLNNIQMLNPNLINNAGLYNLITSKYTNARDLNITFNLKILFDFNNLNMSIYEFSRILGILLDNSIEASKDCNEKIINLIMRENKQHNVQILQIENTYNNKNVNIDQIFEKGISSKQNHSGIGLWEVNQIIKKNKNVMLNTTKDTKFFRQELQIIS